MTLQHHAHLATGLVALATYALARAASEVTPLPRPTRGHRGLQRQAALATSALFRIGEPATRWVGGLLVRLRLLPRAQGEALERHVVRCGEPMGLCAEEWVAATLVAGVAGLAVAPFALPALGLDARLTLPAGLLAGALPWASLQGHGARRLVEIERRLPAAIDLAVLCVGAGMDLRSSLSLIAAHGPRDALRNELERVLSELAMGHTRKQALTAFSERVPSDAVRDFAGAVIEAELRGAPLADALRIQAGLTRSRRSVRAEEAAARASVKLTMPLALLLCCVLLLMFGPFVVNGGL